MRYADEHDGWLTVEECAVRLGMTPARVLELARARVLRSTRDGALILVEPALIPGVTTGVAP